MIFNQNIGLKHLQTLPNVLAPLHAKTNATAALLIALNTIALLIKVSTRRSNLYTSIIFLYLKYPLLLRICSLQMILLLRLHQFILMDNNIIICLLDLLRGFRI